jgi:hypothetical protein
MATDRSIVPRSETAHDLVICIRVVASLRNAHAPVVGRDADRTVLTGGPARQGEDRDQVPSSDLRISQGVLAVRARTSRYRGPPSPRRPRAARGTVVTVNPDAVRSLRTAGSGQVR